MRQTKRQRLFDALHTAVAEYPKIEIYEGDYRLTFRLKGRHMQITVTQYNGRPYLDARVHHPEEVKLLAILVGVIESAP